MAPTLERRQVIDRFARQTDLAVADMFETGDGAQQGELAAARGAEQGEQLIFLVDAFARDRCQH